MTLLTVIFVLGPMYEDGNGWYIMLCTSSMLYHHLLNPLAAIFSFVLLERSPHLPHSTVKWALLPTALYGGIILWLNIQRVVDGPYPFMKVYDQSVQASVLWCIAILLMNYFYAWLLWKLNGGKKENA